MTTTTIPKRGFAALSKDRMREIASSGGRAAHMAGTAHQFTTEEARAAGRKRHQPKQEARAVPQKKRA